MCVKACLTAVRKGVSTSGNSISAPLSATFKTDGKEEVAQWRGQNIWVWRLQKNNTDKRDKVTLEENWRKRAYFLVHPFVSSQLLPGSWKTINRRAVQLWFRLVNWCHLKWIGNIHNALHLSNLWTVFKCSKINSITFQSLLFACSGCVIFLLVAYMSTCLSVSTCVSQFCWCTDTFLFFLILLYKLHLIYLLRLHLHPDPYKNRIGTHSFMSHTVRWCVSIHKDCCQFIAAHIQRTIWALSENNARFRDLKGRQITQKYRGNPASRANHCLIVYWTVVV